MVSIGSLSVTLGIVLFLIGTANAVIMFEVLGRKGAPAGFRSLHRWLGRVFALGVIGFFIYMFPRAAHFGSFNAAQVCHAVLGTALVPLVVAKFLVARRYKAYWSSFPELGFVMLVVTFIAIVLTSGHEIAEKLFK